MGEKGPPLGLKYGPGLVVTAIQPGSLVAEWNDLNVWNGPVIAEGNIIISVNGKTDNSEILKLLRSKDSGQLEIIVQDRDFNKLKETEDVEPSTDADQNVEPS